MGRLEAICHFLRRSFQDTLVGVLIFFFVFQVSATRYYRRDHSFAWYLAIPCFGGFLLSLLGWFICLSWTQYSILGGILQAFDRA